MVWSSSYWLVTWLVNEKNKTTHEEIWYICSREKVKKIHQIWRSETGGYAWEIYWMNQDHEPSKITLSHSSSYCLEKWLYSYYLQVSTSLSCHYPWWLHQGDCGICSELLSCKRTHTECYRGCNSKNWMNHTKILSFWSRIRIYQWICYDISPDESYSYIYEHEVISLAKWSSRILLR